MGEENQDTDPMAEVKAMGKVAEAVAGLNPEATARVLRWAVDRFNVTVGRSSTKAAAGGDTLNTVANGTNGTPHFGDLADLYAATSPESEADKALVAAYWFQFCEGKAEFGSQEINTALKNLGHPIGNITTAFDNLKARKPAPVMQLKKSGTTKQARKTYKLTVAGKQAVDLMIGQH